LREDMSSFASRMKKKSKSRERVTPSSEGRCGACQEAHSRYPPVEEAVQQRAVQETILPANQLEGIFETLAESIIACDREGKILHINAAALALFEVASATLCRGTGFQQFLQSYQRGDEQPPALALEPWLLSLFSDGEETTCQQESIIVLQVPSGRKVYAKMLCFSVSFPAPAAQQPTVATIYVFRDITRRYRKALQLQRVHQAVSRLQEAIAHLPEHLDFASPEGLFLLSPPALFVTRQLVDVISQVLVCQDVALWAFGPPARYLHYAAGSGFTWEQELCRRAKSGHILLSQYVDETAIARLSANQEVMVPAKRLCPRYRERYSAENLLWMPIFLENRLSGALVIAKAGADSEYTPEEIELVKAVATQTVLFIECLRCLCEQAETQARALAQAEMQRLTNDFLNLASHELNTPLTVIKGNLQVAERRLAMLKRQLLEPHEGMSEELERVQSPLASAAQSARLQEHIIKDLLDDARLQANTLELHLQRCDLSALLRGAVADAQRSAPERTIVVQITSQEQVVPIKADAERISRVITGYLTNALCYGPADQPVTVQLTVEDAVARVSVHDEGPGIACEEQGRIWERFSSTRELTEHCEPELSSGLGLYLCQGFIERHHGSVGVQSDPGHGATFWFTLPMEASMRGERRSMQGSAQ
jgi:signal transduction histidine kinase